jgi:[acyl-carrier-protein] S-malonyltransferase
MLRSAFQFPGQGSQYVGMGRAVHDASPLARDLFARADDVVGFGLSALCFTGPDAELRRTENAQPALFTVAAIACSLLMEQGIKPIAVAGHSVGEYTALFAADALSFEDGVRIVRQRGELMARATEQAPGTMAAIIGVPLETVEALCAAAGNSGVVDVAAENGPLQTVVSGDVAAVDRVIELVEEYEGGVAVPLAVSGAFHSRLMAPVAAAMSEMLADLALRAARVPVVANASGAWVQEPEEIRAALGAQVVAPVRWSASIRRIVAAGAERLIEAGPGRTLTRLARELAPGLSLAASDDLLASANSLAGRA